MATVEFTPNLARHIDCQTMHISGTTVAGILQQVCRQNEHLRNYLLDDQDRLRKHVTVFIDSKQIRDRQRLSDPVARNSRVFIAQALSGG